LGPPSDGETARNATMLSGLRTFAQSLRQWAAGEFGVVACDAAAVVTLVDRTLVEADTSQRQARELLDGVSRLLRGWQERAGERMRVTLTRPEWLLDGWGQVCGLWESVIRDERPMQREMLQQIRASLPMLDPSDRSAPSADSRDLRFDRGRRVRLREDWRTGLTVLETRARAELLRAATA
jgi:hypothetical protein